MYPIRLLMAAACNILIGALLFLLQPAGGNAQSAWIISPGVGLGAVKFGMKDTDATAILGAPTAFCLSSPTGLEKDTITNLYYPDRGLIIILNTVKYGFPAVVTIHLLNGYAVTLENQTFSKGFSKCSAEGILNLNAPPTPYATSDGIQLGTPVDEVVAKMGAPTNITPESKDAPTSNAELRDEFIHRIFFMPPHAQVYWYDGIIFGVESSKVVAIGILQRN